MKKFFLILTAFFMLSLPSFAATWVQVGDYEYIDKDSIKYYVDDRGELQFDKKMFWMKTINHDSLYEKQEKMLNKKIMYCKNQWIIDTNKKSLVLKSGISYDKNGNIVANYSFRDYELNWDSIVPESKGEFWYELVRKPKYLKRMYKMQLTEQNQ